VVSELTSVARPMRADARRNYDSLVTAAREEFGERGSDAAIEDIARRAGVGVGTLYRHFPRRIDLVEAVYSTDVDTLVAAADEAESLPDAFEGLQSWLLAFVRYAESKRALLNELHEAKAAGAARSDLTADDLLKLVGGMCMSATSGPGQNERLLTYVLAGIRAS
jgi:AcrR family transcriptional regulator